jgi:tetratricopeptide (TPR) repeat protein
LREKKREGEGSPLRARVKAGELQRRGDYGRALEEIERMLEARPKDPSLLNSRGDLLLKMGRIRDAVAQYDLAAEQYIRGFFHGKAIALCKKVVRVQPDNLVAHQRLAELYEREGLRNEAVASFVEYAALLEKLGQAEAAAVAYTRILTLDAANPVAQDKLSRSRPPSATPEFEGLREPGARPATISTPLQPPGAEEPLRSIQDELEAEIARLEARPPAEKLSTEEPTFEPVLELDRTPEFRPEPSAEPPSTPPLPSEAASSEVAVGSEGANEEEMGDLLLEIGSVREAVEQYERASETRYNQGDLAGAERLFHKIASLRPQELRPRQRLVEVAQRRHDQAALAAAYLELGECLLRRDNPEQALSFFRRVLEVAPEHQTAREMIARLEKPRERVSSEADVRREMPPPSQPEVLLGETPTPSPGVEQAFAGRPILEGGRESRVRFSVTGDVPLSEETISMAEIVQEFKEGVRRGIPEEDYQTHYDLGVAYMEVGLLDEALEEFKAVAEHPEMKLRAIEMLGTCHLRKGDAASAIELLQRVLEESTDAPSQDMLGIKFVLAQAVEQGGDRGRARDILSEIVAVDPAFREAERKLRQMDG